MHSREPVKHREDSCTKCRIEREVNCPRSRSPLAGDERPGCGLSVIFREAESVSNVETLRGVQVHTGVPVKTLNPVDGTGTEPALAIEN